MIDIKKIKKETHLTEVFHFDTIDSTNTYLKQYGKLNQNADRILAISDMQTKGKGRMHKSFFSPQSGLYFSLLYRYPFSVEKVQLVTIIAAVVTSEVLDELFDVNVSIKWLNDLFLDRKKVCGILTEGVLSQANHYEFIVLGIGLNVLTPQVIPHEIETIFTALDQETDKFDKNIFLISFINRFDYYMNNFDLHHKHIISYYKKKCLTLNKTIKIVSTGTFLYAHSITDDGHLLAKDEKGNNQILNSGEVKIKYEN